MAEQTDIDRNLLRRNLDACLAILDDESAEDWPDREELRQLISQASDLAEENPRFLKPRRKGRS